VTVLSPVRIFITWRQTVKNLKKRILNNLKPWIEVSLASVVLAILWYEGILEKRKK
tara:strand:+ start:1124 stop:1291 length:168 start_codon:yes stop_codon:yes gene_type:complete